MQGVPLLQLKRTVDRLISEGMTPVNSFSVLFHLDQIPIPVSAPPYCVGFKKPRLGWVPAHIGSEL